MDISYRKAWGLLSEIESVLGLQLIGKQRGGKSGGKTNLTDEGLELIEAYLSLKIGLEEKVHDSIKIFFNKINKLSDRK